MPAHYIVLEHQLETQAGLCACRPYIVTQQVAGHVDYALMNH